MARKGKQELVSSREAARMLGMTEQAVGQWANQAPADTYELKANRRFLKWPQFPIWYRKHLQADNQDADFEKARARKTQAEAILAEQAVATARGDLHSPAVCSPVYGERIERLRARLQTLPGRGAPRTVGLKSLVESQQVWEELVGGIMDEMAGGDSSD